MGNWCSNRLTLKGEASYLEDLRNSFEKAGHADNWRDVVISIFASQGVTYDGGSEEKPANDTTIELNASDNPASLTLRFLTKWGPEYPLVEAMAKLLPLSVVSLFVEDYEVFGVLDMEWSNGTISRQKLSIGAWELFGGDKLVYWRDDDEDAFYFTRNDEKITEAKAIELLDVNDYYLGGLVQDASPALLVEMLLSVEDEDVVSWAAERLENESPERLPRERLLKAVGSTEEELDGVPDSWLLKLLISQTFNNKSE